MNRPLLTKLLCLYLLLASALGHAAVEECAAVFPDGIQSNSNSGRVTFAWGAQLQNSPDNLLDASRITDSSGGVSCGSVPCAISGDPAEGMDFNDFPNNSNDVYLGYRETRTLYPGDYDDWELKTESVLILMPGEYRIRGELSVGSQAVVQISGDGVVKLLVKGDVDLGYASTVNGAGSASQLLIFARDDITLQTSALVKGFVYGRKEVQLQTRAQIVGAVSGEDVKLSGSPALVTYQPDAVAAGLAFAPLCGSDESEVEPEEPTPEGCEAIFADGAQSHSVIGSITFNWRTQVKDSPDNILTVPTIIDNSGGSSCGSTTCTPSYTATPELPFDGYQSGGSEISLGWAARGALAPGTYKSIELSGSARLTLAAGDYYIAEDVKLNWASRLLLPDSGTVRLFIGGSFETSGATTVNDQDPEQLLLVSRGDIKFGGSDKVAGFFYSEKDLTLGHQTKLTGSVNAVNVTLKADSSRITFDPDALGRASFGDLCSDVAVTLPEPLRDLRMDELRWRGSDDEVTDSSDNSSGGRAMGGASTVADGAICRAAEFDGIDDYIDYPDLSALLNTTTTLSYWIRTTQTGSSTQWLAPAVTGVEESGGQDDIFWGWLSNTGTTGLTVGDDTSTLSSSPINDGAWHQLTLTRDASSGAYQVYVDGALERSGAQATGVIGNAYRSLGRVENTAAGQPAIYLAGQLDELLIFDQALTDAQVALLYERQSGGLRWDGTTQACLIEEPAVDHYGITSVSPGLTCEPTTVTVTAYDDEGAVVEPGEGTSITLTASDGADGWSLASGSGTFTAPATYTFADGESQVTFNLSRTRVTTAPIDIDVTDGVSTDPDDGGDQDQPVSFAENIFRFYADGTADAIGTQLSGKPNTTAPDAQSLTLKAVGTDPATGACRALTSATQAVGFAYGCTNPGSCARPNDALAVSGTTVDSSSLAFAASFTPLDLSFDANGEAALSINYSDAGQIQLYAAAQLNVDGTPVWVTGSSNSFVVKPAGLCVEASGGDASCSSADSSCTRFVAAGAAFTQTVSARAWQSAADTDLCDNGTTPNFDLAGVVLSANLLAPAAGVAGVLSQTSVDITAGSGTLNNQSLDEVGVYQLVATPPAYLGESLNVATSAPVGRFTPAYFTLDSAAVNNACGSFTYLGQNFDLSYRLQARNQAGGLTQNYQDGFARLTASLGSIQAGAADGTTDLSGRLAGPSGGTLRDDTSLTGWSAGQANFTTALVLNRAAAPDGPFSSTQLGLLVNDADGVTLRSEDLDLDSNGDGTNQWLTLGSSVFRFGRGVINNSYGSERLPLLQTVQSQYFDGSRFITNSIDNCTDYQTGEFVLSNYRDDLEAGETSLSFTDSSGVAFAGPVVLSSGESNTAYSLQLSAPGEGNTGSVQLNWLSDSWLQFDWDNDGNHDDDPAGVAVFGRYRGHDRVIFRLGQ